MTMDRVDPQLFGKHVMNGSENKEINSEIEAKKY